MPETPIPTEPVVPERMMTVKEFADLTRRTPGSIQTVHTTDPGSLPPAYKIGGRLLFKQSEVVAWIDARRTTGGE